MPIIQPLDLREIFISQLSGSPPAGEVIFTIISLFLITVISASFRMPLGAYGGIVLAFAFIIGFFTQSPVILGVGMLGLIIVAIGFSKAIKDFIG